VTNKTVNENETALVNVNENESAKGNQSASVTVTSTVVVTAATRDAQQRIEIIVRTTSVAMAQRDDVEAAAAVVVVAVVVVVAAAVIVVTSIHPIPHKGFVESCPMGHHGVLRSQEHIHPSRTTRLLHRNPFINRMMWMHTKHRSSCLANLFCTCFDFL